MNEMLRFRKEELRERGVSGFTLMEMLIVVAIIAILIAIAIPVFTTQMNNSKQAADEANARSLYALAAATYMTNQATYASPTVSGSSGKYTVTYESTTFTFSDICTALTADTNPTTQVPRISITTNSQDFVFGG